MEDDKRGGLRTIDERIYLHGIDVTPYSKDELYSTILKYKETNDEMLAETIVTHCTLWLKYVIESYLKLVGDEEWLKYLGVAAKSLGRCLELYNPSPDCALLTYAKFRIKRDIARQRRELINSVHIPDGSSRYVPYAMQATVKRLTYKEISEIYTNEHDGPFCSETVFNGLCKVVRPVALDDTGTTSGESINRHNLASVDTFGSFVHHEMEHEILTTIENTLVKICNARELIIAEHRFGLRGQEFMTLEELSKRFKLTRERIRQIESSIILRLRRTTFTAEMRAELA